MNISTISRTVAAEKKDDICRAWVRACAEANIPLSKSDHPAMTNFLAQRVQNGGAIPGSQQLQRVYLQREYQERKDDLKALLKGKPIAIICDESSDDCGRYVLLRQGRFKRSMKEQRGEEKPKMVPNPIATRWNSWFHAVKYHKERLPSYDRFVQDELLHVKGQAPESLLTVQSLLENKPSLTAQMQFIVEKSSLFIEMTEIFQSQKPTAINAWSALEELQLYYESTGISQAEASTYLQEKKNLTEEEKEKLKNIFDAAVKEAASKLPNT